MVAIRPNTGEVLAMVGSIDYFDKSIDGQVNVAIVSRQPGSSFKPYTYLTAFDDRQLLALPRMVMDVRTVFPDPPIRPTRRRTTTAPTTARRRCAGRCSARTTSRPSG